MRVVEVWRYPVKSLLGERLDAADVGRVGIEGDRAYGLFDAATGVGLTARRLPALLFAAARLRGDGSVEITLPDGSVAADDEALSAWLERPVELRSAADAPSRTYENVDDPDDEEHSSWSVFTGSADAALHDSRRAKVSMVSASTLGSWDARRFRSNLLLDGSGEDGLVGSRVTVGSAVLDVVKRLERCVMTTRAQPGGIERDLDVLRTIHRQRDSCLAVGAGVVQPGRVAVGDELRVA